MWYEQGERKYLAVPKDIWDQGMTVVGGCIYPCTSVEREEPEEYRKKYHIRGIKMIEKEGTTFLYIPTRLVNAVEMISFSPWEVKTVDGFVLVPKPYVPKGARILKRMEDSMEWFNAQRPSSPAYSPSSPKW